MKTISLLFILILFATVNACHKELEPEIFGKWITTSGGFQIDYDIQQRGYFCRALPEYLDGWSCQPYTINGDTIEIHSYSNERWVWTWQGNDNAIIRKWSNSESPTIITIARKK